MYEKMSRKLKALQDQASIQSHLEVQEAVQRHFIVVKIHLNCCVSFLYLIKTWLLLDHICSFHHIFLKKNTHQQVTNAEMQEIDTLFRTGNI